MRKKPISAVIVAAFYFSACTSSKLVTSESNTAKQSEIAAQIESLTAQNETLEKTLKETVEHYEAEKESWEKTGVEFFDCPDSTPTKIIYDNGKLKSIEGKVKSLKQEADSRETVLLDAQAVIDSQALELERKTTQISELRAKAETSQHSAKEVKKKSPLIKLAFWLGFIIGLVAGILSKKHLKKVYDFFGRLFKKIWRALSG